MIEILIYFFIGISLSVDAFTLAITLASSSYHKKIEKEMVGFVGLFHLFMPWIGNIIGNILSHKMLIGIHYLTAFIFIFLCIEIYLNRNSEEIPFINNLKTIVVLALSVSFDSLSVGLALGLNQENILFASVIFSIISSVLTKLGFKMGKTIHEKSKKKASYFSIILLLIVATKYLLEG